MSTYPFPSDVAALVRAQMVAGNYRSEDDVLRDALKALVDRRNDLAAVRAGIEDMEAGRVRSLEDVAGEIRTRHRWSD